MYRLIYKSRAKQQIDWGLVKELINKSEENNQDAGITGVLLATATHFLQVLEGSYDEVNALFMRIVRDLRHDQVQLVAFDCIESRLYGGWAMHAVGVGESRCSLKRRSRSVVIPVYRLLSSHSMM